MLSRIGRKIGTVIVLVCFIALISLAGASDTGSVPVLQSLLKGLVAVGGMTIGTVLIAAGGEAE